jgi:ribosomal RNA-processing protein 36
VLRKAQRALAQAQPANEDDGDDTSEGSRSGYEEISGDEAPTPSSKGKEKAKPDWSLIPRKDIAKRSNKHAYVH